MISLPTELLGILATIFIFISFTTSDMRHCRMINSIGCVIFIAYGILIGSISTCVLNGGLLILQIYKIVKRKD